MFRKYLAALLLLPASFAVYGSPRAWLHALRGGKYAFFCQVIKSGPSHVHPRGSLLRTLFVVYPMRTGIEILRGAPLGFVLRKSARLLTRRGAGSADARPDDSGLWRDDRPPFIPADHIREMIRQPTISVVSFDIFDTLLIRPALHPTDIFHIVAQKVDAALGVDFLALRRDAEARTGKAHANIREIYEHMARRHGLDAHTAETLMEEEIRCEETLLSPRPDIKALYDEAMRLGKRVIAVSDMYLPGEILGTILKKKGCPVDAVYVSCDHGARKSDGALYEIVLRAEGVPPSEILHVGDNRRSDYLEAIRKKLTAVWYPSIVERCFSDGRTYETLFGEAVRRDPLWSIFLGFSLNRLYGDAARTPAHIAEARDLPHFTMLTFAPLLTAFSVFLATDKEIRNTYQTLYFASRDGWLPHRVYSVVQKHLGSLPGVYFAAGRRAYYPFLYDSFFEYAESLRTVGDPGTYTLHDFIKTYFMDTDLFPLLENTLSDTEKSLLFFRDKGRCLGILRRFDKEIADCMRRKRARIKNYYENVFDPAQKRYLVFDLGYSGSIGTALAAITGSVTDKVYFWETPENREADKALGSTTHVFMRKENRTAYHLLFEELFSPCRGGVTDFRENGQPVYESMPDTADLQQDLTLVHDCCMDFARDFCALLGPYAACARVRNGDAAIAICRALLTKAPFCNLRLLQNIVFPDPVYHTEAFSLEKKMERLLPRATVFSGTGFDNPIHVLTRRPSRPATPFRAGIHAHLHDMASADEIVRYLQHFPVPFDLYVTITDSAYAPTAAHLFSPAFLPDAGVTILPVKNRGRDVAPWLLNMRPHQADYDIFCHIHGKQSPHFHFGEEWRTYLFDNLIHADAAAEIISLFQKNSELGCVFPPLFPPLRAFMVSGDIPPEGLEREADLAAVLLRRMGLRGELRRSELFFSAGTMLWYRPRALRQLFTFDIRLEEFPEEPVGVGGTLAHALERLPAVVAARNGYAAGSFVRSSPFCFSAR